MLLYLCILYLQGFQSQAEQMDGVFDELLKEQDLQVRAWMAVQGNCTSILMLVTEWPYMYVCMHILVHMHMCTYVCTCHTSMFVFSC